MPISRKLNDIINRVSAGIYTNEVLDLSNQEIDDDGAEALADALSENSDVKKVNLYNNQIGDTGAGKLSVLSLSELNLSENNIRSEGARSLSKSKIEFLDLSCNAIGPVGAGHFSNSEFIKRLSLSECETGSDGAKKVLQNTEITILDLSTNDIDDDGVKEISENSKIVSLKLSQNKITHIGAENITKHKKLKTLCLDSNQLGDKGAKAFLNNSTIKFLDLTQNRITRLGFFEICKNNTIENLELFNNLINFTKGDTLPEEHCFDSLIYLNLSGNELDDAGLGVIESLKKRKGLKLDVSRNNIGDKAPLLTQYHNEISRRVGLQSDPKVSFKIDLGEKRRSCITLS